MERSHRKWRPPNRSHEKEDSVNQVDDCTLCAIAQHRIRAAVVHEDADVIAIMDLFPASKGHVLVLPKEHIEDLYSLPDDMGGRILETAIHISKAIRATLKPKGLNLIQANGAAAGQTIQHFHLHIVPRYENDGVTLNFGHGAIAAGIEDLKVVALSISQSLP
jgi:histidine triad (HIT) family protein